MKYKALFIVAALASFLSQAARADNIYVTVDGVNGSTAVKGHEKTIVATAFSLDTSGPAGIATAARPAVAKSTLSLTLDLDASTPELFVKAASNIRIPTVVVEVVAASPDGKERNVLTIKLSTVEIAKMDIHTKAGVQTPTPVVDLTLDAEKIEVTDVTTASATGTNVQSGYNLTKNTGN